MIFFGIAILIGIGITITFLHDGEGFSGFLLGVLVTLVCFLIALLIVTATSTIPSKEARVYELSDTYEIVALKDNMNVKGSPRFLGSGRIDEDLYYYYMVADEFGYYVEKIKAGKTRIKYTDSDFRIEKYSNTKFKHWSDYIYTVPVDTFYVAYIPEGSIVTDYVVDLE